MKCGFGYVCANTGDGTKKCLEQFSVKVGGKAEDNEVCESGFSQNGTCYDTRIKGGQEYQECEPGTECVTEILDSNGKVVGENSTMCSVIGSTGYYCTPTSKTQEWKNYVKAIKEVRDGIKDNKVHQSFLLRNLYEGAISYNSVLRKAQIESIYYKKIKDTTDRCIDCKYFLKGEELFGLCKCKARMIDIGELEI